MVQDKKRVFLFIKLHNITVDKYYKEFKALVTVVESYGGKFVKPSVIKSERTNAGANKEDSKTLLNSADMIQINGAIKIALEKILLLLLLHRVNYQRYGKVCNALSN